MYPLPYRAILLALVSVIASVPWCAARTAPPSPWPAVDSDLPPAAQLREGTLPNGVRFAILPNAYPRHHVSLRLLVAAGSADENDTERGLAHFIEHMAYRGTRSHPDGTLVPALEQLGVALGPDSSAFTYYDHTIYELELPSAGASMLRQGLGIFREFASEITFDPTLIDQERGVILSEARFRDTPLERSEIANLAFLWPGARAVARQPIGRLDQVRTFTRAQFVDFYNAWYRPDRLAIIVVGDVDPSLAERLITQIFGPLTPRGPARPTPANIIPRSASPSNIVVFSDPGLIGCVFSLENPEPHPRRTDTHARRVRQLDLTLANAMFQRRLTRAALNPKSTFVSPQVQISTPVPGWRTISVAASGRIDDWRKVAADLEQAHRRAFLYGFTPLELQEARNAIATAYQQATATAATRDSSWLADQLAESVRKGRVFVDPATAQRDMAPALASATLSDCERAFRAAWTLHAPHVFVASNPLFHITARRIAAALNESRKRRLTPYVDHRARPFAYRQFGPPGTLVADRYLSDLGVRLVRFANGVRCNFKPTKFEADTVEVHVRVGEGSLSQPAREPGLNYLANAMVIPGGLGRENINAITDLLAVSTVRPEFHVESDAFVFTARCSRHDLPFCLQLLAAYVSDPALRADGWREAQGAFGSMYANLATTPGGPISVVGMRQLADNDPRFGVPQPRELGARTMRELRRWLEPQFKRGPIELSVVGDVGWPAAEAAVAATFGALPRRGPWRRHEKAAKLAPPSIPVGPEVIPLSPTVKQAAVGWYWIVPRVADMKQQRRYFLLASILQERLRIGLRDQLGATYTPTASFTYVPGFPRLNWLYCYAEVDPAQVQNAMGVIEHAALSLELDGPTANEFARARKVFLRDMDDDLKTNGYWGTTVLADAQQDPENLIAARNRAADIVSITRAELAAMTNCLDPSNSFRFITTPPFSQLAPLNAAAAPVSPAWPFVPGGK